MMLTIRNDSKVFIELFFRQFLIEKLNYIRFRLFHFFLMLLLLLLLLLIVLLPFLEIRLYNAIIENLDFFFNRNQLFGYCLDFAVDRITGSRTRLISSVLVRSCALSVIPRSFNSRQILSYNCVTFFRIFNFYERHDVCVCLSALFD